MIVVVNDFSSQELVAVAVHNMLENRSHLLVQALTTCRAARIALATAPCESQ
jgi:hypothetical protein